MNHLAKMIDPKGRCCGRKPISYRRQPAHLFCPRCDAAFDQSGKQITNWAYEKTGDDTFRKRFEKSSR